MIPYLDGVQIGDPLVASGQIDSASTDVYIGHGMSNSSVIDDVRIYNRALTSTEISELYNSGSGTEGE